MHSSSKIRISNRLEDRELPRLDDRDNLFAANRGETFKEVINGFATLKRIDQVLQRDTRAVEDGCSSHDFRVGMDNSPQVVHFHRDIIRVEAGHGEF